MRAVAVLSAVLAGGYFLAVFCVANGFYQFEPYMPFETWGETIARAMLSGAIGYVASLAAVILAGWFVISTSD